MARHVKKGDVVVVTAGDEKGRTGEVLRVLPKRQAVIVKGLNLRTKHLKPTRLNPQGGIVTREAPIHISNVSPAVEGRPTRVRFEIRPDGSKVRVAARTGEVIDTVRKARPRSGGSAPAEQGTKKKLSRAARKAARAASRA